MHKATNHCVVSTFTICMYLSSRLDWYCTFWYTSYVVCHRHESSWSLPHEVSETAAADQLATVHPKWRGSATTGLPSISEVISNRRSALFGHVARLHQDVPAHKALHCHVDLSLGGPPNDQWKRRPGRPRERWIDQVRKDNGIPPADLWRRVTNRGHRGATLRPSLASR